MPCLSFDDKYLWTDNDFNRPSRMGSLCIAIQELRAWLLSACPSGTKAIHPRYILVANGTLKARDPLRSGQVQV
jgi:hypothetical protein